MSGAELLIVVIGALQGLGAVSLVMLGLMIGVCVLLTLTKFRPTRNSRTIKSLDETVGPAIVYLPPDVPRGPSDQLAGSRRAV